MASPVSDVYGAPSGTAILRGGKGAPAGSAPDFQGAKTYVLGLGPTGYTLGWPRVTGATEYQYSIDGGSTFASTGTTPYATVTGRTAGSTDSVVVRAINSAGYAEIADVVVLPGAGSPTPTVRIIGVGGDYATPQEWENAAPANLVTANIIWEGWCLQQEFSTGTIGVPGLDVQGSTSSASCYKHLTAAPGCSFVDQANRRSVAPRYNPAQGACITNYAVIDDADRMTIDLREGYARVTRLMVRSTGNNTTTFGGYAIHTSTSVPCLVDQCILETGSAKFTWSALGPHVIRNSLAICTRPASASQVIAVGEMGDNAGGGKAYNAAFICLYQTATYGCTSSISSSYFRNVIFANCSRTDAATTSIPTYENCVDNASTNRRAGSSFVAYASMGFASIAAGSEDFRLAAGSPLIGAGVADATNALADLVGRRRLTTGAIDIGPWQT